MGFRTDFETAWRAGGHHDSLLALVRRYQEQGLGARDAYDVLHQLWLDNGYDDCEGTSPLQDNLEYIMEKLWYEQPATR
ncbi:MAG TPA: hypothetical protein VFE62_27080 [Gemmataceae bacterium]|nr:hypothetical protein [Gemmataceae bacterium]